MAFAGAAVGVAGGVAEGEVFGGGGSLLPDVVVDVDVDENAVVHELQEGKGKRRVGRRDGAVDEP